MPTIAFDRVISAPWNFKVHDQDGNLLSSSSGTGPWIQRKMSRTWARTPNFWSRRKNGSSIVRLAPYELPMNDFSYVREDITQVYGSLIRKESSSPITYTVADFSGAYQPIGECPDAVPGSFAGVPLPQIDLTALEDKARTKSLLDLKDQKVNLVQAFAERKQTARLLSDTITRFASSITALKRGKFGAAANALGVKASPRRIRKYTKSWSENQSGAVASGWLELQYGWRPLLSDVYGSAELLAQKVALREVRSKSVTKATARERTVMLKDGQGGHPSILYICDRKIDIKYTVYYSTPSESHTLAQVGITNPALIAWELTPWSFVVDWFIPIGNYISTLDSTKGLKFEKGCRTFFEKVTNYGKVQNGVAPGGVFPVTYFTTDVSDYLYVNCSRNSISDFPRTALPSLKSPFSAEHVANALALLRTSFKIR